jgi:hypothetical protein
VENDAWIAVIPVRAEGGPPGRPCVDGAGVLHRVVVGPPALGPDFEDLKW